MDFTPGIGHVLDVAALGLPGTGLSVRTHLSADIVPAFVEAEVSAGCSRPWAAQTAFLRLDRRTRGRP